MCKNRMGGGSFGGRDPWKFMFPLRKQITTIQLLAPLGLGLFILNFHFSFWNYHLKTNCHILHRTCGQCYSGWGGVYLVPFRNILEGHWWPNHIIWAWIIKRMSLSFSIPCHLLEFTWTGAQIDDKIHLVVYFVMVWYYRVNFLV